MLMFNVVWYDQRDKSWVVDQWNNAAVSFIVMCFVVVIVCLCVWL